MHFELRAFKGLQINLEQLGIIKCHLNFLKFASINNIFTDYNNNTFVRWRNLKLMKAFKLKEIINNNQNEFLKKIAMKNTRNKFGLNLKDFPYCILHLELSKCNAFHQICLYNQLYHHISKSLRYSDHYYMQTPHQYKMIVT